MRANGSPFTSPFNWVNVLKAWIWLKFILHFDSELHANAISSLTSQAFNYGNVFIEIQKKHMQLINRKSKLRANDWIQAIDLVLNQFNVQTDASGNISFIKCTINGQLTMSLKQARVRCENEVGQTNCSQNFTANMFSNTCISWHVANEVLPRQPYQCYQL